MDYNIAVEEEGPQIPEEMVLAPPARSSTGIIAVQASAATNTHFYLHHQGTTDLETVKEESPHGQEVTTGPASSLSAPAINPRAVSGENTVISIHS